MKYYRGCWSGDLNPCMRQPTAQPLVLSYLYELVVMSHQFSSIYLRILFGTEIEDEGSQKGDCYCHTRHEYNDV